MGCNTWGMERSSCLIPSVPQHGKRNFTRSKTTAHPRVRTGQINTNERDRALKSQPQSCHPASGPWPSQQAEWMSQLLPTGPTEAPSHSPSWGAQPPPPPQRLIPLQDSCFSLDTGSGEQPPCPWACPQPCPEPQGLPQLPPREAKPTSWAWNRTGRAINSAFSMGP